MKLKYYLLLLMLALVLQSCGSGGGSDTMGVLTVSTPAVTGGAKSGDIANVAFTVTYTPPSGKVPNGVIINQKILNSSGVVVINQNNQLYDNTSYSFSFPVIATTTQQIYFIDLSIGSMVAGTSVIIPAGT
jgi:hypothetical protein